ncbi:hypothetical protein PP175_28235 (plasmid) [Aneurinibacillus sp. Ricciae_BoGa-3]|nr:hypothetical protein [Aneurinibacillus sp. Ricciae_BoGa-3]WCK57080.1 hypothetical protein PP175_28235 [Aneurinibacillus sp. Ricciae_BoGa-3]
MLIKAELMDGEKVIAYFVTNANAELAINGEIFEVVSWGEANNPL